MTQCDGVSSPLRLRLKHADVSTLGRRKVTLFMLLDEQLAPLRWGWLQAGANHQAAAARSLWSSVALNAAMKAVDVRLFLFEGQLWASASFPKRGYNSAVAAVNIQLPQETSDRGRQPLEGVDRLVVWVDEREWLKLRQPRARGRSQAFFGRSSALTRPESESGCQKCPSLIFQSWLLPNVVFGVTTAPSELSQPCAAGAGCVPLSAQARRPMRARLLHESVGPREAAVRLAAVGGCTEAANTSTRPLKGAASRCRLSINGVLVYIDEWQQLLGVGHLHRGYRDSLDGRRLPRNLTYFAHHYTHFFYTIEPQPPYAVRMLGSEFCFGAARQADGGPATRMDCEIIQYVSGLTRVGERLLVSYGVNDCQPKVFDLTLRDVRADLRPFPHPAA